MQNRSFLRALGNSSMLGCKASVSSYHDSLDGEGSKFLGLARI